jgi:hypothetical protein
MTTPIHQYFNELEISPTMAHTQVGRRGQNQLAVSWSSFPSDAELTYELERTETPNVPTTDVQRSLDSPALIFKRIRKETGRRFTFSGKEDFTVVFKNVKDKRLTCNCANAAPCSVSSISNVVKASLSLTHYC